jgi:hypothetical protein
MSKTIYDKPTRVLLKDMVAAWKLQPGETFNARRAVAWFAENYPKLKSGSIGQLLRYTNWVRKELAEPGQRVRGIIVCRTMSEDLILACSGIKDIELFEYRLQVTVTRVPSLDLGR